jgi:hypothetical protein
MALSAQMAEQLGSQGSGLVREASEQEGSATARLLLPAAPEAEDCDIADLKQGYIITSKCSASLKVELQVGTFAKHAQHEQHMPGCSCAPDKAREVSKLLELHASGEAAHTCL